MGYSGEATVAEERIGSGVIRGGGSRQGRDGPGIVAQNINRVESITKRVANLFERLHVKMAEILGSEPEPGQAVNGKEHPPSCAMEALEQRLVSVEAWLDRIETQVIRVERL